MKGTEHACTHSISEVIEENREYDPKWLIKPSRYDLAADLLQRDDKFRKDIESREQESIIGTDDRHQNTYTLSFEWLRRICHLTTTVGGRTFTGTGAFIHPRLVLTAAHVLRPTGTAPDSRHPVVPPHRQRGNVVSLRGADHDHVQDSLGLRPQQCSPRTVRHWRCRSTGHYTVPPDQRTLRGDGDQ